MFKNHPVNIASYHHFDKLIKIADISAIGKENITTSSHRLTFSE
jgi:hypothetical protein